MGGAFLRDLQGFLTNSTRRFSAFPRINLPHALLDAVQATLPERIAELQAALAD